MFSLLFLWFGALARIFYSRRSIVLENITLRQQLAVLKRRRPRPRLDLLDKLFWVAVRRFWSGWKQSLIVVTPETVVRWNRAGFRTYWKLISRVRTRVGRRQTSKEIRQLIFRVVAENPTWGAPRIHGELLMLGFDVSERTISRWMRRAPRDAEPASDGLRFFGIIGKPSRRWTSSRSPQSHSACSIVSSSSAMAVGAFRIAMSLGARQACGSFNNYAKPFHLIPHLGS